MTNSSKIKDLQNKNRLEVQKGVEIYKDRPYIEENRPLKNIALLVYYVSSFFSWITQGYGLWFLSFLWLSSFLYTQIALGLSVVLAIVGATVIELVKNIMVHRFFKSFFNSNLETNWIVCTVMVGMFFVSLGLSFWASLYIPNVITERPTLVDVSKIEKEFDAHISDIKEQRDNFRKDRLWMGKLSSKDAKIVHEYNDKIKAEKEAKNKAIETAQNTNNTAVSNWVTQNNTAGEKIGWFMVFLEFLVIGAVAYYYYYYWQAASDNLPPPQTTTKKHHKKRIELDDDDDDAHAVGDDDSGQTINDEDSTTVDNDSSTITEIEYIEVIDNEKVDTVKRLKDAICKNYERSFSSKTPEARKLNAEKLKERMEVLNSQFGIKTHLDETNRKVLFSSVKTA